MLDPLPRTPLNSVHDLLLSQLQGRNIRIYEAGGGSRSYLPLDSLNVVGTTVVDIDPAQLENNSYADVKILGDIQEHQFPSNSFDLIVCYNVIEHLDAPDKAIRLFLKALSPGGLVFLGAPNPSSFSGIVTKYTPHWFHVAFYRWVVGRKDAGKPGKGPFRTIYHRIVSPDALVSFCEDLGFEVIYKDEYQAPHIRNLMTKRPVFGLALNTAFAVLNASSFGRKDFRNGDYHVVLKKPA
jgi:SAM-dependent methyltransferase